MLKIGSQINSALVVALVADVGLGIVGTWTVLNMLSNKKNAAMEAEIEDLNRQIQEECWDDGNWIPVEKRIKLFF